MPDYADIMAAVDRLMLAHTNEIRGGSTPELREAVAQARAQVATMIYTVAGRRPEHWTPDDDPAMPKKRRHA